MLLAESSARGKREREGSKNIGTSPVFMNSAKGIYTKQIDEKRKKLYTFAIDATKHRCENPLRCLHINNREPYPGQEVVMKMTTLRKQITKPIGILLAFVLLCSVLFFPASAEQISGLKTNIGLAKVSVPSRQQFQDGYCEPEVKVTLDGKQLTEGTDYTLFYANNLNKGTAKVYIVGMGDYYGIREASFNIVTDSSRQYLYGSYLGNAGGTLSEDYHYQELIVLPAYFTGVFNTQGAYHVSAYNL
jgi:hypothetical protein